MNKTLEYRYSDCFFQLTLDTEELMIYCSYVENLMINTDHEELESTLIEMKCNSLEVLMAEWVKFQNKDDAYKKIIFLNQRINKDIDPKFRHLKVIGK